MNLLNNITTFKGERSRAVSPENPTGEKGRACMEDSALGPQRKGRGSIRLPMGEETVIADIKGPGIIRHIWMTIRENTEKGSFVMRDVVLRIYWDNSSTPAVEAPLGDFFCNGFGERCDIASLPIVVNPTGGMNSYFEMPFRERARITITNEHPKDITSFFYTVNYAETDSLPENTLYFHAYWKRERQTELAKDYVILDKIKGKGYYVGTFLALTALERYWWGEGEFKFYLDGDTDYPTICGTGTEDYIGFAWGMDERCTPQSGCPYCDNEKGRYSIYRFHGKDPIYFQQGLKLTVQQIGCGSRKAVQAAFGDRADVYTAWGETDESDLCYYERSDDYCSAVYWYQTLPTPAFPKLPDRAARMADL